MLSEIPRTYAWASFDNPTLAEKVRPPSAIAVARGMDQVPFLAIHGPTSTGKSILGVAMVRATPGVRYLSLLGFRTAHLNWREKLALRDEALEAPALLLDDLIILPGGGRSDYEEWVAEQEREDGVGDAVDVLEGILHGRAAGGRRTILTTSATKAQLQGEYSFPIANYFFECPRIQLDPQYDWFKENVPQFG